MPRPEDVDQQDTDIFVTSDSDLTSMNSSLGPGTKTGHTGTGDDKRLDIKLGENINRFPFRELSLLNRPRPEIGGTGVDWFLNIDAVGFNVNTTKPAWAR